MDCFSHQSNNSRCLLYLEYDYYGSESTSQKDVTIGDMILTPEMYDLIYNNVFPLSGQADEKYRWPKGELPYTLSPAFCEHRIEA